MQIFTCEAGQVPSTFMCVVAHYVPSPSGVMSQAKWRGHIGLSGDYVGADVSVTRLYLSLTNGRILSIFA